MLNINRLITRRYIEIGRKKEKLDWNRIINKKRIINISWKLIRIVFIKFLT